VRWTADATHVWTERDGLVYVNAVVDCADRACIGRNALVYASELYRNLAREYGLRQEFIRLYARAEGVIESFMGTFKLECV